MLWVGAVGSLSQYPSTGHADLYNLGLVYRGKLKNRIHLVSILLCLRP